MAKEKEKAKTGWKPKGTYYSIHQEEYKNFEAQPVQKYKRQDQKIDSGMFLGSISYGETFGDWGNGPVFQATRALPNFV